MQHPFLNFRLGLKRARPTTCAPVGMAEKAEGMAEKADTCDARGPQNSAPERINNVIEDCIFSINIASLIKMPLDQDA